MKSEEVCYLLFSVICLISELHEVYILHKIFQYEGTDAGEDVKQSLCLGNFFSHFSWFGTWCSSKVFWILNEVWEEWDDRLIGSGNFYKWLPSGSALQISLPYVFKVKSWCKLPNSEIFGGYTFFSIPLACMPSSFLSFPPSVLPSFHGKGMLPAVSANRECCLPSGHEPLQWPNVCPEGNSGWRKPGNIWCSGYWPWIVKMHM